MVKEPLSTQAPNPQTKSDDLENGPGGHPYAKLQLQLRGTGSWRRGFAFPMASWLLKSLQGVKRKTQVFFPSLLLPPGVFDNEVAISKHPLGVIHKGEEEYL